MYAVEIGTVQPLAHPCGESQLLGGQDGRVVQYLDDGLEPTLARVRALLRRAAPQAEPSDRLCAGDIVLSLSDRTVTADGREISLTYKEFELLALLLENKGTVLRRDTILDRIWGYSFEGGTRTVDVHVRTLRQKLGDAGAVIETVRGVGYKINR